MSVGMIRNLFNASNLTGTNTITSDIFRLDEGADLGIYCKATAGLASYTPILEVSYDDKTDNFISPVGYPSIATATGSAAKMYNITQYNMMYGRIKMTGATGNPTAGSTMTAYIFNREDQF